MNRRKCSHYTVVGFCFRMWRSGFYLCTNIMIILRSYFVITLSDRTKCPRSECSDLKITRISYFYHGKAIWFLALGSGLGL